VALERSDDQLHIAVSDTGSGYDPELTGTRTHTGLGLLSIKERLSLIGGSLKVETAPGSGTRSVITVPLAADASAGTREVSR